MTVFQAIADDRRREILRHLSARELTVGELVSRFDVSQPAISQHLKILREAGLVDQRREGARRLYRARPEGFQRLHEFLTDLFDERLERLKALAEAEVRSGARHAERN